MVTMAMLCAAHDYRERGFSHIRKCEPARTCANMAMVRKYAGIRVGYVRYAKGTYYLR